MAQTTKKDFKLFKKECRKWLNFFGLKQWTVHLFHRECEEGWAEFYPDVSGRTVTIVLNTDFTDYDKVPKRMIRQVAFHEIVEGVLLAELRDMLFDRGYTRLEIDKRIHPIVRTLENSVFE